MTVLLRVAPFRQLSSAYGVAEGTFWGASWTRILWYSLSGRQSVDGWGSIRVCGELPRGRPGRPIAPSETWRS